MDTYKNYINGEWVGSDSGKTFRDVNPANTDEILGCFQDSTVEDAKKAIKAARDASEEWRNWPGPKRGRIFLKLAQLLADKADDLSTTITREMGKTLTESNGEVNRAKCVAEYMGGEGARLFGSTVPSERKEVFAYTLRQPLGVVAVITPWNFPLAIPSWKIIPALVAGNTVVFKPASLAPLSGIKLVKLLTEAGIPKGVVNLVTGSGAVVGSEFIDNSFVKAISFTGSSDVGSSIYARAAKRGIKVQAEMGGVSPVVVLEDADLEQAAEDVIAGAFGATGQKCTATRMVIVQKTVERKLAELIVEKAKKLKVGDPLKQNVDMGPIINDKQLQIVLEYINDAKKEGCNLLFGGKRLTGSKYDKGFYILPTIFGDVKPEMKMIQKEVFGPVLSIISVNSFENAIKIANSTEFGLSSAIYTNDISRGLEFVERVESGMTHINMGTVPTESQLPFGGIKRSGIGPFEQGKTAIEFFTETKTVWINYAK